MRVIYKNYVKNMIGVEVNTITATKQENGFNVRLDGKCIALIPTLEESMSYIQRFYPKAKMQ